MDLIVPIILFLAGFGFALLAGRRAKLRWDDAELDKLPLSEGAVRLDLVGRGAGAPRPPEDATTETSPEQSAPGADAEAPGSVGKAGHARRRPRRQKK